jgi:hypothetical protein
MSANVVKAELEGAGYRVEVVDPQGELNGSQGELLRRGVASIIPSSGDSREVTMILTKRLAVAPRTPNEKVGPPSRATEQGTGPGPESPSPKQG